MPVDAYGVGSALIRGSNDFTADVVLVDGRPRAKVGREHRPNPRLTPGHLISGTKRTRSCCSRSSPAAARAQQHEPLVVRVDRPDEPPALAELLAQRRGNVGHRRGDVDRVVGRRGSGARARRRRRAA